MERTETVEDEAPVIPAKSKPGRPRKDGAPVNNRMIMVDCEFCRKSVRHGIMYQRHINKHHPNKTSNKKHSCPVCETLHSSPVEFLMHAITHWEPGGSCPLSTEKSCALMFSRRAKMQSHLFEKHSPNENETSDINTIRSNTTTTSNKSFQCDYCKKTFARPSQLIRHVRIHTGEKPFVCAFCGLKFNQKNSLVVHVLIHSDRRPHKCPKCPAAFIQKSNLRVHMKKLHPLKACPTRIPCPYCLCLFRKSKSLQTHCLKFHQVLSDDQIMMSTINNVMEGLASLNNQSNEFPETFQKAPQGNEDALSKTLANTGHIEDRAQEKTKSFCADEISMENLLKTPILKKTRHECNICLKTFQKSYDLKRHMNTHSNNKQLKTNTKSVSLINADIIYSCDRCSKTFQNMNEFLQHQRSNCIDLNMDHDLQHPKDFAPNSIIGQSMGTVDISSDSINSAVQSLMLNEDENMIQVLYDEGTLKFLENNVNDVDAKSFFIPSSDIIPIENPSTLLHQNEEPLLREGHVFLTHPIILPDNQITYITSPLVVNTNVANEPHLDLPDSTIQKLPILENDNFINTIQDLQSLDPLTAEPDINEELFSFENTPQTNYSNNECIESAVSRDFLILKESLKVNKPYKNPPLANACEQCPASFSKSSDLIRHQRVHSRERPFVCGTCKRGFTVKCSLDKHRLTHLSSAERKKETCQVCGKLFATKNSMKVHMRLHEGTKSYACTLCSSTFRTIGHRTKHLKTHFKSLLLKMTNQS